MAKAHMAERVPYRVQRISGTEAHLVRRLEEIMRNFAREWFYQSLRWFLLKNFASIIVDFSACFLLPTISLSSYIRLIGFKLFSHNGRRFILATTSLKYACGKEQRNRDIGRVIIVWSEISLSNYGSEQ